MPIYQTINEMLRTQAVTENVQSETQKNIQQILMQKKNMEMQDQMRQAFADGAVPSPATVGGIPGGGGGAVDADGDPLMTEMADTQRRLKMVDQEAGIYRRFGNFPELDKAEQRAAVLKKQSLDVAEKLADRQGKQAQQMVQSIGAVTDQPTYQSWLTGALRQAQKNPQLAQQLRPVLEATTFDDNGAPVLDAKAQAAINQLKTGQINAYQQAELSNKAIDQTRQAVKDFNDAGHQIITELQKDKEIAARQSGAEATRGATEANRREMHEGQALSRAQTISSAYKSDEGVKKFAENVNAYKAAKTYLFKPDENGQPVMKPTSEFDSASDSAFVDDYFKVAHPGRALRSVYELKGVDKMAGVPDRILQGIKNIIVGKEIPSDVRADMFKAMDNKFRHDNEQQIEREDATLNKVRNLKLPTTANPEDYVTRYAIRPEGAASAKTTAPARSFKDGDVAVNPKTGERLVFMGGQWLKQ